MPDYVVNSLVDINGGTGNKADEKRPNIAPATQAHNPFGVDGNPKAGNCNEEDKTDTEPALSSIVFHAIYAYLNLYLLNKLGPAWA